MSSPMDFPPPVPIHKLFINYIFLNELSKYFEGISGYKLRKTMNNIISQYMDKEEHIKPSVFSQSMVYRAFKDLKTKGLIDANNIVIKNRNQTLYKINEKGKKRLQYLKKIIMNLAPIQVDPNYFVKDFLSGKISPIDIFDKLSKDFPKDQFLVQLKSLRGHLTKTLQNINTKIEKLEKELLKKQEKKK